MTATEIPATRRSESTSELARKNDDDEELQSDELQGLPEWLEEFNHELADESVPEH